MTPFDAGIRIVDDGFFHPIAELSHDFIDSNRFHHVPVEGLTVSVQFVRTSVQLASARASDHLVLWVNYPRMDDAALGLSASAISGAFPGTPATFVRDVALKYVADRVDVDTQATTTQEHAAHQAIAAVCAAQCWGTLADVERITIRLDGVAYFVRMRCEPPVWRAIVSGLCDSSR
jgi:hypothetical protein